MTSVGTKRRALITGIGGQDGSYLAELLREKGYEVVGVEKGDGNIADPTYVTNLVQQGFDEIYNLAGVSTVAKPDDDALEVAEVVGMAPAYFLEAIRTKSPQTHFFQASSAEMYGDPKTSPQDEETSFQPKTPYAVAKLFAHRLVEEYRTRHNVFAVSGILFNHESPRRGTHFVTRKITSTIARIQKGSDEVLTLGNLDAVRDWTYAGDIVRGMHLAMTAAKPGTYVFASGETHTVREFVVAAGAAAGLTLSWDGQKEGEIAKDQTGRTVVAVDPAFYRPLEVTTRQGDITKATKELDWKPEVSFTELVRMMVEADLAV